MVTILDCYTDEPAGLGVPPYLGTYPRYLYGYYSKNSESVDYLTIDDLRFAISYSGKLKPKLKTDITVYNTTKTYSQIMDVLKNTTEMIIVLGVHTPGKYLSAQPGTINEVIKLLSWFKFRKVLTGPAVYGNSSEGGQFFEKADLSKFNEVKDFNFTFKEINDYAMQSSGIIDSIPDLRLIEIETGRGCSRVKGCSFCTEPLKHKLEFRDKNEIIDEISLFYEKGIRDFRLGKQSCFYSYPDAINLLSGIKKKMPDLRTLHIDNVDPAKVVSEKGKKITSAIVENCTPGNVAAFGVESFDSDVASANNLNSNAETAYEAVRIVNEIGSERGENGMQKFLPGINILFGLAAESKKTHAENMKWLTKIYDDRLLLRRINVRQVNIFEGTPLFETVGNKFLRKNTKYYWKWRNEIRQKIDFPMLQRLLPVGTVLNSVRMEVYDGNHTFGRQIGTYPLIVGIEKKVPIKEFYSVRVKAHMLRSVVGEIV